MLKKRLIGVVTVKNGLAVQSIGYSRYLPLGKPEVVVENLDRWGADEIMLQCIDRSPQQAGPDFDVLKRVSRLGLSTPLIYAGGLRNREDAVKVVSHGADRVMIDSILNKAPDEVEAIARDLGTQALIAHLPLHSTAQGVFHLDYHNKQERPLQEIVKTLPTDWVSEVMLTDWVHEGTPHSFDEELLQACLVLNKPLICFGGISESSQIQTLLAHPQTVAVGVGNFLNYREHAVQALKARVKNVAIRMEKYQN